jgi:hypothetical protein
VRVSDLPTVLERLADPDFLDRVVRDPKEALSGYRLTRDDVSVLAARLADEQEVLGFVEQRVAKAGMFSLLSSALHGDDAGSGHDGHDGAEDPDAPVGDG